MDLTLIGPKALTADTWIPKAAQVDCTAPYAQRWRDGALDMGTGYDCFDERAHTANPTINATAKENRQRLSSAMEKEGFAGYSKEWWHFTFGGDGAPKNVMDFPITPLSTSEVLDSSHQLIVVTTKTGTTFRASPSAMNETGPAFEKSATALRWWSARTGWRGVKGWATLRLVKDRSNVKVMGKHLPGSSDSGLRLVMTRRPRQSCLILR